MYFYNIKEKNLFILNENNYIIIENIDNLNNLINNQNLLNFNKILINFEYIDNNILHTIFFIGKEIYLNYELNTTIIQKIILNPCIAGFYNISNNFKIDKFNTKIEKFYEIQNDVCFINFNKILINIDINLNLETYLDILFKLIKNVWGYFKIYDISNLPEELLNNNSYIISFYSKLINRLGIKYSTHPVNPNDKNNINTIYSESRDIKYIENSNHFYTSNIHQPLHNDYAYYPENIQNNWLSLYALEPSEYGGITSIITNKKIIDILKKYDKKLLNKINNLYVNYKYIDINNEVLHKKKILINEHYFNWNYYQIKKEYNDNNTIETKEEFFNFLENFISNGKINTLSKKWNRGDCILFNDHLCLHERSSFLGNRWLKDHCFKDNKLCLY